MPTERRTRRARRQKAVRSDVKHWPKMIVRAARDEEGEEIHVLVDEMTAQYGWTLPAMSWGKIAPFWYVVEHEDEIIGAVQVCIGWPVGRMELLSVKKNMNPNMTAKVVKLLLGYTSLAMRRDGTLMIMGIVPRQEDGFMGILERLGAKHMATGRMVVYHIGQ